MKVTPETLTDEMIVEARRRSPLGTLPIDCDTALRFRATGRWWWGEVITSEDNSEARQRICDAINPRKGA